MATDPAAAWPTSFRLPDGQEMPLLGLGVWQVPDGPECVGAVEAALAAGYRHIDTAQAYGNERSVGEALRSSGVPRDQLFITTKFYPQRSDAATEAQRSLERLGLDYLDLYIVHWPQGGATWAWPGLEQARERGYTRSIGVSNFSVADLDEVTAIATNQPAINQVQFSPFEFRSQLLDHCRQLNIALESYSSLGTGRHLSDPTVRRIADALSRTPAQVLLRWCVQRGIPVLPKSTHRERIEQNGQIFDFSLPEEAMAALDGLDTTDGTGQAVEHPWW